MSVIGLFKVQPIGKLVRGVSVPGSYVSIAVPKCAHAGFGSQQQRWPSGYEMDDLIRRT